MTNRADHRHVDVREDERLVGLVDVEPGEAEGVVRAAMHVEPGHLPMGSRSRLVDAVLDLPELQEGTHLEAAVPLGDTEILQRIQERLSDVQTRSVGSTCLVDAELPHEATS